MKKKMMMPSEGVSVFIYFTRNFNNLENNLLRKKMSKMYLQIILSSLYLALYTNNKQQEEEEMKRL